MMIPAIGARRNDARWRDERRSTVAARARATGDGNDLRTACRWLEPAKIASPMILSEKATVAMRGAFRDQYVWARDGLNVRKGKITNRAVAEALGYELVEPKAALAA